MKRILAWIVVAALCPATVFALGLGKIELKSGLNQPFNARIELLSPTRESLDSLTVSLAGIDAFERAGIQRPFVLSQLKFEVKENEHGADYIHVYSRDPIREPYLDFLVEANWSNGRLYREYTVLLDPPLYDANARQIVNAPAEEGGAAPAPETTAPSSAMQEGAAPAPSTSETAPSPSHYAGGDYGPTVATDTLWSIAGKTRPDTSVSVQQMMLALLKVNPDAFVNNNVNGLKRGVVLHMPTRDQIDALTQAQALAQVKSQYAMWDQIRGTTAAQVQQRPEGTPTSSGSTAPAQKETETGSGKSELRLVSASKENGQGAGGSSASGNAGGEKLQLAQEQLDSLKQENTDLKSRLSQSENIISDLKRLISLKDKDLSALQQQLAGAKKQQAPAAAAAAKPAPKKAAPAPAAAAAGKTPGQAKHVAKAPKEAAPAPAPESGGIVARIKGIVSANLVFVGGGLGAVVIAMAVLIWIKRRKGTVAEIAPVEMPGYVSTEDETEIPGAGAEELEQPETEAPPEAEQEPEAADAEEPQAVGGAEVIAPAETEAPAPAAEEPEEDPLAEVNVFLAYEHFDQAEDFVREAIAREPDNLEFHAKLLEVFYAASDKKKYEEAAKVLHDKVGGEGPHWDMALAMWQEMSPNRALFEEGAAEEEAAPEAGAGAGGVLDLTAEESSGAAAEPEGLDFDLGDTAAPAGSDNAGEDEILDLTAGSEEEGSLDGTAGQAEEEDLLDVTAAVALEPGEEQVSEQGEEDNVLDVTGGTAESGEDILDISSGGNDGLLDVTAQADLDNESIDEDLLDVTAVSGGEPEQGLDMEGAGEEKPDGDALDLDLGSEAEADNVIEFEGASSGEAGEEKGGDESQPEDAGLEFDLSMDTEESTSDAAEELSLEQDGGDEGLEFELDDSALEIQDEEPAAEAASADEGEKQDEGFDLDLTLDEDTPAEAVEDGTDLDMEGTVEIPKIELEGTDDEDDEDDDEDHTVFVPRTKETTEQSAEDEIATKLDLARPTSNWVTRTAPRAFSMKSSKKETTSRSARPRI